MSSLVLSSEQAQQVSQVSTPILVLDEQGRTIGVFTPEAKVSLSPAELDKILDRMSRKDQVWRTTDEVIERLKSRASK